MHPTNPTTPLLSLCIPTYNRAALLGQSLGAIFSQIGPEDAAWVEVLILDNASTDDTPAVVTQAQTDFPYIPAHALRNPENIGPDRNFLKAIGLARGRFVYLISDDDVLLPGAVSTLLRLIREHPDFDGFSLNARTFRRSPEEESMPWFPLGADVTFRDKSEVLGLLQTSIGFMSILAFNKSRIEKQLVAGDYEDKIGSNFLQCFLFLDALSASEGVIVLAQPLLAQRAENSPFDNYFRIFVTGINKVLTYAERGGYSRQVISRVKSKNLIDVRHFVSRVKIYGNGAELWPSRPDAIRRLFEMYGFQPYLWLVVVPLMFFPRFLSPLVLKLRRVLGRPEPTW